MKLMKNARTEADVDLLAAVFVDLLPDGRVVTHEQIEALLRMSRRESRYRTVVRKWRARVFAERNVYLDGQVAQGRGFVVLTPDEMVRFGNRRVREAGRRIRVALAVAAAPRDEELSADVLRYRGLLTSALEKIAANNRTELRAVSRAMQPPPQLPRRQVDTA